MSPPAIPYYKVVWPECTRSVNTQSLFNDRLLHPEEEGKILGAGWYAEL